MWVLHAPASPRPGPDDWVSTSTVVCQPDREAAPEVTVSQQQFRRLPIPASQIIRQPAAGPTLINIATNFLTKKQPTILPTQVLGQPVRVRATPAQYQWRYGDGGQLTTADPGSRYPYMPTAHVYTAPGTYQVSLTTLFTGEFSVAGGPWQPITGTATVASPAITITAEERRAVLIS